MSIAIVLQNPKYAPNVGNVLRAASNFGAEQLWWSGDRVSDERERREAGGPKWRLPREERMRAYSNVTWGQDDFALNRLVLEGFTPVCVELVEGAEVLPFFEHPEGDTVYLFGPEDGSVSKGNRTFCHRFVQIPSTSCLNLAAAVNVLLYDRAAKAMAAVPA